MIFLDLFQNSPKEKYLTMLSDIQKKMPAPFGGELRAFVEKHTLLSVMPEKLDAKISKKI